MGVALRGFTQTPPSKLFCVCRRSPLRPLYCPLSTSPRWASNTTFPVDFWPAYDQLPSSCRYPHNVFFPSFFYFFIFFIFFLYCWFPFLYLCFFSCCCLIFRFIPLFPNRSSFLFLLVIRLYHSLWSAHFALIQTLGCRCERFPSFLVEDDEFRREDFALKAKEYVLPMHWMMSIWCIYDIKLDV